MQNKKLQICGQEKVPPQSDLVDGTLLFCYNMSMGATITVGG
jgi:hypothetical protein